MAQPYIRAVDVAPAAVQPGGPAVSVPLLPGEVSGAVTTAHTVPSGSVLRLPALRGAHRALYLIEGAGSVSCGEWKSAFNGLSFCVPRYEEACEVAADASGGPATLLELVIAMGSEDEAQLAETRDKLPYCIAYAACSTYKEAIKSPKTVSRTLLHPGLVPRFATGSVQTTGADSVGAHAHPMLEQFFLGLPGNDCLVSADGHTAPLRSWTLLHIPLGSTHGVTVEEGRALHYVWIDIFRSKDGERWIHEQHKDDV